MARVQLDRIQRLVDQGVAEGATCWQPQMVLSARGFYYPPTLLSNVHPTSIVAQQEIFGPVLATMTFRTPREAVELAVKAALALNCTVRPVSRFARKNYFYPDLPKGYQISQYDEPLASSGAVTIELDGEPRTIGLERLHLEEDAGKSVHDGLPDSAHCSYVDLNRAGVPLIEIVSRPELHSPAQAYLYLQRLRSILRYTEVCDGNMERGELRCDANSLGIFQSAIGNRQSAIKLATEQDWFTEYNDYILNVRVVDGVGRAPEVVRGQSEHTNGPPDPVVCEPMTKKCTVAAVVLDHEQSDQKAGRRDGNQ